MNHQTKVISLEEAIERFVRPGMALFVGDGANAAVCQIIRQFWGKKPEFTLIATVVHTHLINMIQGGLVKKVITTNCAHLYPLPGPSRAIQRAYREKTVDFEEWSLCTLHQRLLAGATGLGFMPTKALIGSSMAEDNKESITVINDPFGSGKKLALLKALNPDIALVHAACADRLGNNILVLPYIGGCGAVGAMASKGGAVLTTENIVPEDFIRGHSSLAKLPGHMVASVSPAEFGAHPRGMIVQGVEGVAPYDEDAEFQSEHRSADVDAAGLNSWIKKWVLDCANHEDYLHKLGRARLSFLKEKLANEVWGPEPGSENTVTVKEYNSLEMMCVAASRIISAHVLQNGYKTVLSGVGLAGLASWMSYFQLQQDNYELDLLIGSGYSGFVPRSGSSTLIDLTALLRCRLIGDSMDTYTTWVGGENSRCLAILGAAQIDRFGNINTTKIPGVLYLIGSGGANDAGNAAEVIVVADQSKERFIEKVAYVTCDGENVKTLVSSMGIFEKIDGDREFTLTHYFPEPGLTPQQTIEKIKSNCGWAIKLSSKIEPVPGPAEPELKRLRSLDSKNYFIRR